MTHEPTQPMYGGPVDPAWAPPRAEEFLAPTRPEARGGLLRDISVILGGMALLGIVCGLVWTQLGDHPQLIRTPDGVGQDELQLSKKFAVDGWYALIGGLAALLAGIGFGAFRQRDLVATVLLVAVGCVAAAYLMRLTGEAFGPVDPTRHLMTLETGAHADAPLVLDGLHHLKIPQLDWTLTWSTYFLAWPLGALFGLMFPLLTRND